MPIVAVISISTNLLSHIRHISIYVLDASELRTIAVDRLPAIAFNPINKKMYVSIHQDFLSPLGSLYHILLIDGDPSITNYGRVTDNIQSSLLNQPYEMAFNHNDGIMYVTNLGSDNITKIDGTRIAETVQLNRGDGPWGIVSALGGMYVANQGSSTVAVIS
jgi:DNA-binding beta-propeller fold protein YncE